MRYFIRQLLVLAILFMVCGCAKQGYPTGGPKDVTPPVVVGCTPNNESTLFSEKEFFVEFDEYVVLKDAQNNVLVSPPMEPKPEFSVRKRGVLVKLPDSLQANTTYLFQFRDAVADFNEGNTVPSLEYAFSTGQCLDSMTLHGRISDALTLKAPKSDNVVTVLLLSEDNDTAVRYQTRCDKSGSFRFNYIQPGAYRLIALEDGNRNLRPDADEAVAFLDSVIHAMPPVRTDTTAKDSATVDSTKTDSQKGLVLLRISTPKNEVQRVTNSEFTKKGCARIITQIPMLRPQVTSLGDEVKWSLNAKRDTMTLWTLHETTDSLRLVLYDSSFIRPNDTVAFRGDTLKMRFRQPKTPKMSASNNDNKLRIGCNFDKSFHYFDTLRITFSTPVRLGPHSSDSVLIYMAADSSEMGVAPMGMRHGIEGCRADDLLFDACAIDWHPTPGKTYSLTFLQNAVEDLYSHRNDSVSWKTEVTKPEKYGNIVLTMTYDNHDNLLVQLLSEKDDVLSQQPATAKVTFNHLKAGKYRLRVVEDLNRNRQWDPGDYFKRVQPERVFYYEKTLDVRENWDFEETWDLTGNK